MADDVQSDGSSETEKEDDEPECTPAKAAGVSYLNPQSDNKMDVSIRSSSSTMSKRHLLLDKTPQGSIYPHSDQKSNSNQLAEDNEIVDEEAEEVEE